jgi:hypothetical protein
MKHSSDLFHVTQISRLTSFNFDLDREPHADGAHRSGDFTARGEGQFGLDLVLVLDDQRVGKVDAAGMNVDDDLARRGFQRGPTADVSANWRKTRRP